MLSLLSVVVLCAGGCAATPAGITGYDAFVEQTPARLLSGPSSATAAARCFEEQASFLPLSEFSRDPEAARFTYRLRVAGLWFEQVRIAADGGGSRAEVRVAPNLDAKWQADFDRDRGTALQRCLNG